MQQIGQLHSVQVGTPRGYVVAEGLRGVGSRWRTSFVRSPSPERRRLFFTHLEGNRQADTKNHGALDQAVLMYAAEHYRAWQVELGRDDIGPGGFAENFSVHGMSESTACIGDIYGVGEARIRVTGPRYPCVKIERRWGIAGLTDLVAATGRTGWYCQTVQEGDVEPGMAIELVDRPCPTISIALINDFAHRRNQDVEAAKELAACPHLPEWWQRLVVLRAMGQTW